MTAREAPPWLLRGSSARSAKPVAEGFENLREIAGLGRIHRLAEILLDDPLVNGSGFAQGLASRFVEQGVKHAAVVLAGLPAEKAFLFEAGDAARDAAVG